MMKISKILLAVVGMIASLQSSNAISCSFLYYNSIELKGSIAIYVDSSSIVFGGIGNQVFFCDKDSEFVCFDSEALTFAFPRQLNDYRAGWKFNSVQFEILNMADVIKPAGEERVYVIQATKQESDITAIFSFSYESGLLGIGMRDSDGERFGRDVFVAGDIGYGANRNQPSICLN